jgi:metal-responsive CopG/Arc/MetJ family transcriptional regulator
MLSTLAPPSGNIDGMKRKAETVVFSIRLPKVAVDELDQIADAKFESRAGMVSRIVLEWLEQQRAVRPKGKHTR